MIFLTVGTHEPFTRLIRAMDDWAATHSNGAEVFGQITDRGLEEYTPKNFEAVDRMSPKDYQERFAASDIIVSHAGMGSILTALSKSKLIVVMPRRGHLRETRNDHQYDTVAKLDPNPGIFVAMDEDALPEMMDKAFAALSNPAAPPISDYAEPRLTDALRSFILDDHKGSTQ